MKEKRLFINRLISYVIPTYNELSIFLISVVFLLLLIFDVGCRNDVLSFYQFAKLSRLAIGSKEFGCAVIILSAVSFFALFGIILSFYHIMVPGKKDGFSELCMKCFALIITGFTGIKCGLYVLETELYKFIIFPVWNILLSIFFIYAAALVDEIPFDHTDAKLSNIIFSLIFIFIIFCLLHFVLQMNWALTFSIGVSCSFSLNRTFLKTQALLKNDFFSP